MDEYERIIRRMVEGQIRSFVNDHPEVLEAVKWYKPRSDKRTTFINSIAKRIVRELCDPQSRKRVKAALLEHATGGG